MYRVHTQTKYNKNKKLMTYQKQIKLNLPLHSRIVIVSICWLLYSTNYLVQYQTLVKI